MISVVVDACSSATSTCGYCTIRRSHVDVGEKRLQFGRREVGGKVFTESESVSEGRRDEGREGQYL